MIDISPFRRFFAAAALILLAAAPLRADQLIMLDGSVMEGSIITESANHYTFRVGKAIYLRIEKSQVRRVVMADQRPVMSAKNNYGKPSTAPVTGPQLINVVQDRKSVQRFGDNVTINETVVYTTYTVSAAGFAAADRAVRERKSSRTEFVQSWSGKAGQKDGTHVWEAIVIRATMTVVLPVWAPSEAPTEADAKNWNELISRAQDLELDHMRECSQALKDLAQALRGIRASSEGSLMKDAEEAQDSILSRTESRRKGIDRKWAATPRPSPH